MANKELGNGSERGAPPGSRPVTSVLEHADRASQALRRRRPPRRLVALVVGLVLAAGVAAALLVPRGSGSADVIPGINQASASLLSLDVLGSASIHPAPNFSLTDQHGRPVSLAQFRGDSVILSFNDDRCPDICPLLAQAIVAAKGDLSAAHVVFLSVNVNPFFPRVADVAQWTTQHGLDAVRSWHFGTAPVATLERVWHAYGVYVQSDPQTQTVVHGAQLFFVGPRGRMRAIGNFGVDAADTRYFAHAMAQVAVDLLPSAERHSVGGPVTPPGVRGAISPGAPAPDFLLPSLRAPSHYVGLQGLSGKPTVISFWSTTCASCPGELAALQGAHEDLGAKVNFVAIDVANDPAAALSVASRAGVTFPVVEDKAGSVASLYAISAMPYTFIVNQQGAFKVMHPGSLTTEQVQYVLGSLFPSLSGGAAPPAAP